MSKTDLYYAVYRSVNFVEAGERACRTRSCATANRRAAFRCLYRIYMAFDVRYPIGGQIE